MPKCKICGARLAEGTAICPTCGANTTRGITGGPASPRASEGTTTAPATSATVTRSTCPHCGAEIFGEHRFCDKCGRNLKEAPEEKQTTPVVQERHCPSCGSVVQENARFCPDCGARFGENPQKAEIEAREQPEANSSIQNSSHNSPIFVPSDEKELQKFLIEAIKQNDTDAVKAVLDSGYDVNKKISGITPLGFASMFDSNDVAALLIQRGAPVKGMWIGCGTKGSYSPLMVAALNNSLSTAKILLDAGADSCATTSNGHTALKIAEKKRYIEMQRLLIQYGAKSNSVRSVMMKGLLVAGTLAGGPAMLTATSAMLDSGSDLLKENW